MLLLTWSPLQKVPGSVIVRILYSFPIYDQNNDKILVVKITVSFNNRQELNGWSSPQSQKRVITKGFALKSLTTYIYCRPL